MHRNGRIAFNACFTAFGVAITVARLTIRYYVNRNAHKSKSYILGDVFVVLALLFAVAYAAADMWLNKMAEPTLESAGLRYPELMEEFISAKLKVSSLQRGEENLLNNVSKTNFFLYVVSVFALYTVKASFLCFYSDLTKGFKTTAIPVLYGVIGITVSVVVVNIGWIFGSCVPISRFW